MPNSANIGSLSLPLHVFVEPTLFIVGLFSFLGAVSLLLN